MEWYEDPARAQDAVFRAFWKGVWRTLGLQAAVILPVAILFPVFAQSKVGPKYGIDSVPVALQATYRKTGRWPRSFGDLATHWKGGDRLTHRAAFLKLAETGSGAEYAVAFDGRLATYRIAAEGRPEPLGFGGAGTLGPKP